ncbi:NAD-dependent epimerase/dehydratase family protein [Cohnella panacarvi]|uniref:NAD-dependent epimerase/dehydratase family protein n=1 Tax=Cohnella panacarvi TaxID=400776 RepID=UPI00047B21C2|nr:NAD-dependent epimerase/dehydratase family protein [Cohnella panacarvi]
MRKILITGSNSYIGTSLVAWLETFMGKYQVDTVSLRDEAWRGQDFSAYETVLHLAGIAHVSADPRMEEMYYKVNRDLTVNVARKAKAEGVKQFVFMSSIIVYGDSSGHQRIIDKNTVPTPSNFYGKSKLQAEQGIQPLEDNSFKVVVLRPPMIYGKGSKGNYPKLAKAARKLPIFPDIHNQRSLLHIDNLCEFIRLVIDNEERGAFFPQNKEYVKTSEMVKMIAEVHGRRIRLTKAFNPILKVMRSKVRMINKLFGNLCYEMSMSEYKEHYAIRSLRDSIVLTEK